MPDRALEVVGMDASYPVIVGFVAPVGRQTMNDEIFRRAFSVACAEIDFYAADARETLDPYQLGFAILQGLVRSVALARNFFQVPPKLFRGQRFGKAIVRSVWVGHLRLTISRPIVTRSLGRLPATLFHSLQCQREALLQREALPLCRPFVKLFVCQSCGRCGHQLAFLPEKVTLSAIEGDGASWKTLADGGEGRILCANAGLDACNWLIEPGGTSGYCRACRHNGTVPDLSEPSRLAAWRELELAKHRLFYSLIRWKLPLKTRAEDPAHGLIFNFLADDPAAGQKVMTGHDNGLIT